MCGYCTALSHNFDMANQCDAHEYHCATGRKPIAGTVGGMYIEVCSCRKGRKRPYGTKPRMR